jgi:hypothetical protein
MELPTHGGQVVDVDDGHALGRRLRGGGDRRERGEAGECAPAFFGLTLGRLDGELSISNVEDLDGPEAASAV